MKILVDTHIFLWWIEDDPRLSDSRRSLIADGKSEIYLSAASGWEIAIKARLGRITLPDTPLNYIPKQAAKNNFIHLPVTIRHTSFVYELPSHHNDPFDRLLISQATLENMTIMTKDTLIPKYDVKVI